ncbi:Prophage CP4-57 regulatory [Methylobacterium sp. 4-46]|uniref:helix-turn-helix transcriptional regulator n=1 Tax=unclassified Methylobacterium TaxID=2615210 RepID=UPI000152D0DC|nr:MULTISPECIES: prophage CP4-57 regulatory [Methylobacterium]ACA21157.1 Prophage CP4-57 regulatory [Methylobacterium sp. 4-46]WFT80301.1 transcriptional regulator [Methylobacterium nodulans]
MRSLTIPDWCERHKVSRAHFYNLLKAGKAPRIMKIGAAVRITEDADREWCRAREDDAATFPKDGRAAR